MLPRGFSQAQKLALVLLVQDQVYTHFELQKALSVVENLTHGLAGHGGRLRAVPSKPPRASLTLKRRVALSVTSSSLCVQDGITKSDTKLFVKQKLVA